MAMVIVGVAAVALSARVTATIPGSNVPQSAQTLAVLVIGGLLGPRDGVLTLLAYLLVGGAGVPAFSDGASGWAHVIGPTAGYLVGFVVAAWAVGMVARRGLLRRALPALAVMICAHALILSLGWLRLWQILGSGEAFRQGVAPFVVGGGLKSVVAAAMVVAASRLTRAGANPPDGGEAPQLRQDRRTA